MYQKVLITCISNAHSKIIDTYFLLYDNFSGIYLHSPVHLVLPYIIFIDIPYCACSCKVANVSQNISQDKYNYSLHVYVLCKSLTVCTFLSVQCIPTLHCTSLTLPSVELALLEST